MPKERQDEIDMAGNAGMREWMESPQGRASMDRMARSVLDAVVSRNLPVSIVNKDPFGSRADSNLFQEIRSELMLFFLENAGRLEKHLVSGHGNFSGLVKQRFLAQWLSSARTPSADPFRYLYKRTQDLLRDQDGFFIHAKKGRSTAYSKNVQNRSIPPLVKEDLRVIPFPAEYRRRSGRNAAITKGAILGLAAYFWEQVHVFWEDEPVWVDIRDFISWIALHVPLKRASGTGEFPRDGFESPGFMEGTARADEDYWDPDAIKAWAVRFFRQTGRKQLLVFRLFHQENQTLGEIARDMGYKGSSGPKYALDRMTAGLRFFLRDLPWLSPDDFNEEAFAFFFDTLFSLLKDQATEP